MFAGDGFQAFSKGGIVLSLCFRVPPSSRERQAKEGELEREEELEVRNASGTKARVILNSGIAPVLKLHTALQIIAAQIQEPE